MKRRYCEAEVTTVSLSSLGLCSIKFRAEQPLNALPGQFIILQSLCPDKLWGRPFAVAWQEANNFSILFEVRGRNTEKYSKLESGDKIKIIGPLGKPLCVDFKDSHYIFVAGGMGISGWFAATLNLEKISCPARLYFGARDRAFLDKFDGLKSSSTNVTVQTIADEEGMVTDLLERDLAEKPEFFIGANIIACGPEAMLCKTAEIAAAWKIPCQVIMETLMACGVGSCKGCAIPKKDSKEYFHLCHDGPALPADEVDWEKLRRQCVIVPEGQREPVEEINMQVTLIGQNGLNLVLPSPVILDSGCFESGAATDGPIDLTHIGAVSGKGTTVLPKSGNPGPRVCEIPSGMMNSIGLENVGLKAFIKDKLSALNGLGKTVIANISGDTSEEFANMAAELEEAEVKAICLNISCPNIKKGGQNFSMSAKDTYEVVKKVIRRVGGKMFVFVKLSPMAGLEITNVALAAEEAGADALWLVNTYSGMKIDLATRRPAIGNVYGGVSGPAMMPIALRLVHLVCKKVHIPVVGDTGIENGSDAAEYLIVGAQAVAVGTALLHNPNAGTEIFHGLREVIASYGMRDIKELVGSLIL